MEDDWTEWQTGLCACCEDSRICCYAFWCFPCFICNTSMEYDENYCLPCCGVCSLAIFSACGIPLAVPPAVLALRVAARYKYNIKGTLCKDIATACFCQCCAWCQIARENKRRKKNIVTVVSVKTIVSKQPA